MLVEAEAQIGRAGRSRGFSGGHGNIDRRQRVLVQAKGLAGETFDAIACHGGTEGARRDAQTQASMRFMIGQNRKRKERIGKLFPAPFHFTKFGRLVQTLARLEKFTDRNASLRERVTGRVSCGPWHGGGPAIDGRFWWPCAHESRGSGHDADYWG